MKTLLTLFLTLLTSCGGGEPMLVVSFYGDSITSGTHSSDPVVWSPAVWAPTPVQHFAALAGVQANDHSQNGASIADANIANDGAELAVIRFGVADQVRAMASPVFAAHVDRLVAQARALDQQVLLTGLPHAASVDTAALDAVIRERAAALGVPFVDIRALPFGPGDLADPLHPSEDYSRRIGAAIAAQIAVR